MTSQPGKKTPQELMREIWDAQGELNKTIGIDTIKIGNSDTPRMDLVEDYLDEAINELFECKENFIHKWWVKEVKENKDLRFNIKDLAKVKLELIDTLHFMTSAAHLRRFNFHTFCLDIWSRARKIQDKRQFYLTINYVIKHCVGKELGYAFQYLFELFKSLDMTFEEIHKIYFMKNEANFKRQENNYSMATKTEEDNQVIEKAIEEKTDGNTNPKGKSGRKGKKPA